MKGVVRQEVRRLVREIEWSKLRYGTGDRRARREQWRREVRSVLGRKR